MADGQLHKDFQKFIKPCHWQRIESGLTSLGIPDHNYCLQGHEGWVENKWTSSWKVTVRGDQVGWIERRARAGGRVFVAVKQTGLKRHDLWLLKPDAARMLHDKMRLDNLPGSLVLVHSTGGPAAWDWDAVRRSMIMG